MPLVALFSGSENPTRASFFNTMAARDIHVETRYAEGDLCSGKLKTLADELFQYLAEEGAPEQQEISPKVFVTSDTPATLEVLQQRDARGLADQITVISAIVELTLPAGVPYPTNFHHVPIDPDMDPPHRLAMHMLLELAKENGLVTEGAETQRVAIISNWENEGLRREEELSLDAIDQANLASGNNPPLEGSIYFIRCEHLDANGNFDLSPLFQELDEVQNLKAVIVVGDPVLARTELQEPILAYVRNHQPPMPTMWDALPAVMRGGEVCFGPKREDAWNDTNARVLAALAGQDPAQVVMLFLRYELYGSNNPNTGAKIPATLGGITVQFPRQNVQP